MYTENNIKKRKKNPRKSEKNKAVNRLNSAFLTVVIILLMVLSIYYSAGVKEQINFAVNNCLTIIIPSLYGFMILSDLAVRTGIYRIIAKPFGILAKLFNIPKDCTPVFLISMVGGFPVGAKMICDLEEAGKISNKTAQRLSWYCFASGPAFITGTVGGYIYGDSRVGLTLFLSIISGNILVAIVSGLFEKSEKNNANLIKTSKPKLIPEKLKRPKMSFKILTDSVESSAKAMMKICGMILMCAVLIGILKHIGLGNSPFFSTVIDVTNIVTFPKGDYSQLPLLCCLLSFGGVCVFLQIMSIGVGKINPLKFLFARICGCGIAFLICDILDNYLIDVVAVSNIHISTTQNNDLFSSIIPVLALLLMTFMILGKRKT
jgi:hypothetical protein